MKDCFGTEVRVNDLIAYATRRGSDLDMHVARVNEIVTKKDTYGVGEHEFLRVECLVGTGYEFTEGLYHFNKNEFTLYSGRKTTLRVSGNFLIISGFDGFTLNRIRSSQLAQQQAHIDEKNAHLQRVTPNR